MKEKYLSHWDEADPMQGSGYRALTSTMRRPDAVLLKAASVAAVDLHTCLPNDLTVWIDPRQVAYRIGGEGSVCHLQLHDAAGEDLQVTSSPRSAPASPSSSRSTSPALSAASAEQPKMFPAYTTRRNRASEYVPAAYSAPAPAPSSYVSPRKAFPQQPMAYTSAPAYMPSKQMAPNRFVPSYLVNTPLY